MKYSIEIVKKQFEKGEARFLHFWGHAPSKNGETAKSCFSQWWPAPFEVDGLVYQTAEHWMMHKKALAFNDFDTAGKILTATTPKEAKALGRQVTGFDEAVWNEIRYDVVLQGSLHKFGQNNELKTFLLSTKQAVIVEASPVDPVWGIGLTADNSAANNPAKWRGLNLLGFALMEARDILYTEQK